MHWRQFQELQKIAEIGDRFISYVEAGEGAPVVLLHGVPTWGYLFHRVLPMLEGKRRVLVPDLPGYGFSDRSDRFSRALARQAERVIAWMQAIGVERASFVGHDVGAALALKLAATHPERVDRLCLVDAAVYDAWPEPFLHELGQPEALRRWPGPALLRRVTKALEHGFARPEPELLEGLLAPLATEVGQLSLVRGAAALDCGETMELAAALPSLAAPALVLWGEADAFQPLDSGRRLAWDLPRAKLAVVPEAGHFCVLDKPAETAAQLLEFLEAPADSLGRRDARVI